MRRSLQLSLFAVVLVGLIGGSLAYFAAQKAVTLTIDGQAREVATYADTVGEVLADEGIEPAAHDVLLPAADQPVGDGDTVVLNRARPLQLTVDVAVPSVAGIARSGTTEREDDEAGAGKQLPGGIGSAESHSLAARLGQVDEVHRADLPRPN